MKSKDWTVVFDPSGLAPGEQRVVGAMVGGRTCFRGEVFVHHGDSDGLQIVSVFVGNRLQRPPQDHEKMPVPLSHDQRLIWMLDPCDGALTISIVVKNTGNVAKTFHGTFVGRLDYDMTPEEQQRAWEEVK